MARHKVRLADNIARVVFIDPEATKGARLGTNLYTPDGKLGTPETVRNWLGLGVKSTLQHKNLQGLQVGDDHPQYTMWAAKERITGQWNFEKQIWGADGTAAAPEFTFTEDVDTGLYRVGANNMGISTSGTLRWDINTTRIFQNIPLIVRNNEGIFVENENVLGGGIEITVSGTDVGNGTDGAINFRELPGRDLGFRFFLNGAPVQEAWLRLYAHNDSADGLEMMNFQRTTGNVRVLTRLFLADGSAGAPSLAFSDDTDSGMFRPGANSIGFATSGVERMFLGTTSLISSIQFRSDPGSAGSPTYSFSNDLDTGAYRVGADSYGISTGGTLRLSVSTTATTSTLPLLGPGGVVSAPAFTFSDDPDTGMYRSDSDILAFSTGGVMRFGLGASGELLDASGSPGESGQVPTSAGPGAAWVWDTGGGGGGGGASLAYVNSSVPTGNTVANTTTETAFTSSYTIPAGQLQAGSVVRLKLFGTLGSAAVAPTLRLRVKLGTTTVLDTGAVTLTAALSDQGWAVDASMVCFSDGETGTLDAQGVAEFATGAADGQLVNMVNTSTVSLDTTDSQALTVTAEWGAADTDSTITLREMTVDLLDAVSPTGAAPSSATYLTENDETANLPSSRRLVAGTNVTFDDTTPGQRTINASGGGGGSGALAFVGETTLESASDTITVSDLDLDTDECYLVQWSLNNAAGGDATVSLTANADTTASNYRRQRILQNGTSVTAARTNDADLTTALAGQTFAGQIWIRRGQDGIVFGLYEGRRGSGTDLAAFNGTWQWSTTGANVTSLTFTASQANAFSIGCQVRVWKLTS